jgi:hypothetical protein
LSAVSIPTRACSRWIVGPRVDLALVTGSSFAGFFYIFLYSVCHVPISYLWWFWSVGFDGTHILRNGQPNLLRSRRPSARCRSALGKSAVLFALGPALVLLGLKHLLALIVAVWAYYHVVRQHYGFLVL